MTTKPHPFPKGKFIYEKGPLTFRKPWRRPTQKKFDQWWSQFSALVAQTPFWVWLCGGFLERKPDTWDVDIILSKPDAPSRDQYAILSHVMMEGTRLAHEEFNILVDIQFFCNLHTRTSTSHQAASFWYSTDDWLEHGATTSVAYVFFDRVYKNGQALFSRPVKKLSDDLYEMQIECPSIKHIERYRAEGYKYQTPRLLHRPQ